MTNTLFMGNGLRKDVNRLFASVLRIVSVWSELIIVVTLIFSYFVYSEHQRGNRLELIKEPKIHDFYFVDYHAIDPSSDRQFRYVPLKISKVDGNLIKFKVGNIGHTTRASITEHVKYDLALKSIYFKPDELTVNRELVQNWVNEGVIYDLARPNNIFINGWIVMHLHELTDYE